ncbi:hypothetical protein H2200_012853 [Cladophialophora chaetospira]|uniref:Heterokaryon incompatibility domain-containing protein n=1 Tax=Cladophialophora chaetospira TaxID=386627 RepID=A0AA39CBX8_9EURO|nr:hypothetical protein H2200_012853 [Cladophialophora chaetospira]
MSCLGSARVRENAPQKISEGGPRDIISTWMRSLPVGWLFFGPLRTVLSPSGIDINIDDFVISDDRDQDSEDLDNPEEDHEQADEDSFLVDTTNLSLYTLYWITKETHIHDEERNGLIWSRHVATFSKVNSNLNKLIRWRREFYPVRGVEADEPPVLDSVILSIVLLSEYLLYACEKIFSKQGELTLEWELDNALRWRLLCAGWCPGEIAILEKKMIHSTSTYLLGTWDRLFLTKDHTKCTVEICLANNIDESIYETKHVSPECKCYHQGEDDGTAATIACILESGSIPVIQVLASGEDTAISVRKSTDAIYVAISHVWSDGLGNPTNNTLPDCQLRKLQDYVNGLYPERSQPVCFWIDTICVPREMNLRKRAIQLMADTYRGSDKVLVVDSWLRQTGFTGHPSLDLLIVKACTWGDRLWTLQESILAKRDQLHFQTDDGPVAERDLYKTEDMR